MKEHRSPAAAPAELLNTLVEIVPMALAFIDRSYRVVYANEAASVQVGIPRDELEGMLISEAVPEFWPELKSMLDDVLAGETIRNQDVDLSELSEARHEWLASFFPVRENDEIVAVACSSVDVTELRDIERELKVRNDLFAMLARVNGAVSRSASKGELFQQICEIAHRTGNFRYAWIGEPDDGVIKSIASAGDDQGYMRALEANGLLITTDPHDPRSHGPTGQAYLLGKTTFVNDYSEAPNTALWRAAAAEVGFRASAALPIREHGRVVAVLTLYAGREGFFTDELVETLSEIPPSLSLAMERFELEGQRQANQAELMLRDRALTAATQGVVITDALAEDNPIIYATPAFEDLTGYLGDEIVGKNCRFLQGPDTDPEEVRRLHEAIAAGQPCEAELINYRKNGEEFWNRLTIYPISDPAGTLTHFVGVQTDITERRILENQVRQAQKMEAVGQLAGGVAHDFNNALTAIRGTVDMALTEAPSGSVREDLLQIDKAAELAARLTQQLLAFSRRQVLQPEPTDLNQVVTETAELIAPLIGDNVALRKELGSGLAAVLVDRAQLQQVIMNMAINARDAMPNGGRITIETSSCDLDESYVTNHIVPKAGRFAMIEITDNGIGMDEATLSKVFEPFFTTKDEGTGLGLATVYGIVNQSGGYVDVESEPHLGTTFRIYLPTTTQAIAPPRAEPTRASDSLDGNETILHVEDSEMLRPLLVRALGRRGYTVLSAANAEEALDIAKNHPGEIDLVLTDIVMPGLNGRELAELLIAQNPGMRVLFTSGYPADMVIRQGIAEAEVNFIEKPFLAKDLLQQIRSILDAPSTGGKSQPEA